jgi:NAD-dependent deacetylase
MPFFRARGGIGTKTRPTRYNEFWATGVSRDQPGRRGSPIDASFAAARPGRGHRALASLYRRGQVPGVITQNIDNLHQASGIAADDVVELHGNTTYAICLDCGKRYDISWMKQSFDQQGCAADCLDCSGYIKTATVSFGQAMPEKAMRRAQDLTRACDLFIAIGSSLVVWPAAGFPLMAKRNGAALVIINREPTEFDEIADLTVPHDIGDALESFISD